MSYFVVCTFDLADASYNDYKNAYADLEKIGLYKRIPSDQGEYIQLPSTTTAGEFNGNSAESILNDVKTRIEEMFKTRGFDFEVFIAVGKNWAWFCTTT